VKSDGEWFINCPRIRATGAKVLRWKNDMATEKAWLAR
jgi:hypothetical protein